MFKTKSTRTAGIENQSKTLFYAHHGWGKTYQCRYYQQRYGKGLIISGESGLMSVSDVDIDFLPFTSWDGAHDPDNDVYSFRGIVGMMRSEEFAEQGYKWVAIDSLTEVAERLMEHLEREQAKKVKAGAKPNGFEIWADYNRLLIAALKWVRDLPLHVLVTALAKDETDANDKTHYWPHVKGQAVSKQVPAIFDHVFCGDKVDEEDADGVVRPKRFVITDTVRGYHGKTRDPNHRLTAVEQVSDITELLARIAMPQSEWDELNTTTDKGE